MKTKIIFLVIALLAMGLNSKAESPVYITPGQASQAALHHLLKSGKQHVPEMKNVAEILNAGQKLAYVFELDPAGYIVVGALAGLPPVIAYSFESHFGGIDDGNPLYSLLKADLTKRASLLPLKDHPSVLQCNRQWEEILGSDPELISSRFFEQWPATGDGWLKSNWTQSPPYNNLCPMDPVTELRSYAGCPATAMAQILNFHECTNNTHFDDTDDYYHNYAGRQYWIDDDHETIGFPSFTELNTYLDTLSAHYLAGASLSNNDKAALTFACGVAAHQVFTSQGSGTFGVNQAYEAYLRFGCNTVALLDSNDTDLFDRLKQNIIDTLPAHLAVVDEAWSTGHNVVVDGYNTDEYYHINFGWGGAYNGWYLLPEEIPYELTVIEGLVVDIMKKLPIGIIANEISPLNAKIFPNPTGDHAMLEYTLTENSPVSVAIMDPSGRVVLEYQNGNQQQGRHQVALNFTDIPAGMYFYSIRSGNDFSTGKVVKAQ
jgi:hypothetical protein